MRSCTYTTAPRMALGNLQSYPWLSVAGTEVVPEARERKMFVKETPSGRCIGRPSSFEDQRSLLLTSRLTTCLKELRQSSPEPTAEAVERALRESLQDRPEAAAIELDRGQDPLAGWSRVFEPARGELLMPAVRARLLEPAVDRCVTEVLWGLFVGLASPIAIRARGFESLAGGPAPMLSAEQCRARAVDDAGFLLRLVAHRQLAAQEWSMLETVVRLYPATPTLARYKSLLNERRNTDPLTLELRPLEHPSPWAALGPAGALLRSAERVQALLATENSDALDAFAGRVVFYFGGNLAHRGRAIFHALASHMPDDPRLVRWTQERLESSESGRADFATALLAQYATNQWTESNAENSLSEALGFCQSDKTRSRLIEDICFGPNRLRLSDGDVAVLLRTGLVCLEHGQFHAWLGLLACIPDKQWCELQPQIDDLWSRASHWERLRGLHALLSALQAHPGESDSEVRPDRSMWLLKRIASSFATRSPALLDWYLQVGAYMNESPCVWTPRNLRASSKTDVLDRLGLDRSQLDRGQAQHEVIALASVVLPRRLPSDQFLWALQTIANEEQSQERLEAVALLTRIPLPFPDMMGAWVQTVKAIVHRARQLHVRDPEALFWAISPAEQTADLPYFATAGLQSWLDFAQERAASELDDPSRAYWSWLRSQIAQRLVSLEMRAGSRSGTHA